jgi:hypothetical protein
MEKQLLPNMALKPAYDKVVWMWVYRDFSGGPADKIAEMISFRFGVTSWPQHFLIDPETLADLSDTGRSVESFLAAVDRTKVEPSTTRKGKDRLEQAEARLAAFAKKPSVTSAKKLLDDEDIVVRYQAFQFLVAQEPKTVVARAGDLLQVSHDPFRYEVCEFLGKLGDRNAKNSLELLVANPKNSRNPNVLRMNAVTALGSCGDLASVSVIQPFAASGDYLNGLTRTSVTALVNIAARNPNAREKVRDVLKASYPKPPSSSERDAGYCLQLAKHVHESLAKVTGKSVPFPATYDESARERLAASW